MQAGAISASGSGATAVAGAIRQAAQLTGANFAYLLATARVESNFNPSATAPTSSAGGLFQFLEQTWLSTLKQAGPAFGYGQYAGAITQTATGRYVVEDPQLRSAIMQLRNDPAASSVLAGVFTNQNTTRLAAQIGRDPSEAELYIAHFLGAAGAGKLIETARADPGAPAARSFPIPARANPAIFYDRRGSERSVSEVYGLLVNRYQIARATAPTPLIPAEAGIQSLPRAGSYPLDPRLRGDERVGPSANPPPLIPAQAGIQSLPGAGSYPPDPRLRADERGGPAAADSARAPNAHAAAIVGPTHIAAPDRPIFHSLFQAGDRREPISPLVTQLWAPLPPAAAPGDGGKHMGAVTGPPDAQARTLPLLRR